MSNTKYLKSKTLFVYQEATHKLRVYEKLQIENIK